MKKYKWCLWLLLCGIWVNLSAQEPPVMMLSFEESLQRLQKNNHTIRIADKAVEQAREEQGRLHSFWYPSVQSAGTYVHLSEDIAVKQSLSYYTDPVKDLIRAYLPGETLLSGVLDLVGGNILTVPLAPRNLTTVDLTAEWVLFTGGKRIQAGRIGQSLVDVAREQRAQVDATQRTLLAEGYYGLRLAQQNVRVREETYMALCQHYENAVKMEEVGLVNRAVRLFAQVMMDETHRHLKAARKEEEVAQSALKQLLNIDEEDETHIIPTSPLFLNEELPPKEYFLQNLYTGNHLLQELTIQEQIASRQIKIDQSAYMPNIALFGKQTLYAHNIQSNLVPRTMVGIGFAWNIFDGLEREKKIRQSRLTRQTVELGREKAKDELEVGVDKLYSLLQRAQDNVKALGTSIELSEELVRMRTREFAEGIATSTEVIDAETLLSHVKLLQLASCYEYDVVLMNLLALCGIPETFTKYSERYDRGNGEIYD